MLKEWRRYQHERAGMLAGNVAEAGGFFKSRPDWDDPDLQVHFMTAAITQCATATAIHGTCACYARTAAASGGSLRRYARRPAYRLEHAVLRARYEFAHRRRANFRSAGARPIRRPRKRCGFACRWVRMTTVSGRSSLIESIRLFILVGTCRMGSDDVNGVEGLRIVDHADHYRRKYQRSCHHDRRKSRGHDP
ncbi:Choline dehydrogenase [Candidatus Paraburkholderia calva]|nr:Choline dehydrogenase [Candidatus Paraburkholderia calva]